MIDWDTRRFTLKILHQALLVKKKLKQKIKIFTSKQKIKFQRVWAWLLVLKVIHTQLKNRLEFLEMGYSN